MFKRHPHAKVARLLCSKLFDRLGSDADALKPLFDNAPDLEAEGEGWERRYAQWWAELFAKAQSLLPGDEEIAYCAATWASIAESETIGMLRKVGDAMGRAVTIDDVRSLLIKQ